LHYGSDKLIVALDFSDFDKALRLVDELGELVTWYKVGMELFYAAGSQAVRQLKGMGKEVFLDLKLHDIPHTVSRAVEVLASLGVSMLNVHAAGGPAMLEAAAKAASRAGSGVRLLAVTVLTSLGQDEWLTVHPGATGDIAGQVVHLARLAERCGFHGVVASPAEAVAIRNQCGRDFLIVTPGIRPAGSTADDQVRVATPRAALAAGADYLVVGRPVTGASNPRKAVETIIAEMEEAR